MHPPLPNSLERQDAAWNPHALGHNYRTLPSDDKRRSPRHAPPGTRDARIPPTQLPPQLAHAPTVHNTNTAFAAAPLAVPRQDATAILRSAQQWLGLQFKEKLMTTRPPPTLSLDGKYQVVSKITMPTNPAAMNVGVHTVRDPLSGTVHVQKLVRVDSTSRLKALNRELSALYTALDHGGPDSINRIISHFHDSPHALVSITLEYCTGGSLADLIRHNKAAGWTPPVSALFTVAWALARALSFLHYGIRDFCAHFPTREEILSWNGVLHLDIKPENVFLKPNPGSQISPYRVVLSDFGCSVTRNDITTRAVDPYRQGHGTEGWFPPENVHSLLYEPTAQAPNGYYGRRTDIWQVGGVLQCLALLQRHPMQQLVDDGMPLGLKGMQRYGAEAEAMAEGCMAKDLQTRFSAPQLGNFILRKAQRIGIRLEA